MQYPFLPATPPHPLTANLLPPSIHHQLMEFSTFPLHPFALRNHSLYTAPLMTWHSVRLAGNSAVRSPGRETRQEGV